MYFRLQVCYGCYCSDTQGETSPILHETVLLPGEYIEQVDFQYGGIIDGLNVFHTDLANSYTGMPTTEQGIYGSVNAAGKLAYFSGRLGEAEGVRLAQLTFHFTEC